MTVETKQLLTENMPYPSGRVLRMVYRSPIALFQLGLGPLNWALVPDSDHDRAQERLATAHGP